MILAKKNFPRGRDGDKIAARLAGLSPGRKPRFSRSNVMKAVDCCRGRMFLMSITMSVDLSQLLRRPTRARFPPASPSRPTKARSFANEFTTASMRLVHGFGAERARFDSSGFDVNVQDRTSSTWNANARPNRGNPITKSLPYSAVAERDVSERRVRY